MRLRIACGVISRAMGLLHDGRILAADEVLMLVPCHDIHTFGMAEPIDVAFVDELGHVVRTYRQLAPCKRLSCPQACAVLERITPVEERGVVGEVPIWAVQTAESSWFSTGQQLALSDDGLLGSLLDEERSRAIDREEADECERMSPL